MIAAANTVLAGWLGKLTVGIFALFGTARYGVGLYAWRVTEKLERPTYEVIRQLTDGVELRRYESYLIAETTTDAVGFREPTKDGFRTCAGYIFGKNKSRQATTDSEKMAMTAPVRITGQAVRPDTTTSEKMAMTSPVRISGGKMKSKVSFVIGSKYSLKTAPKPLDRNVIVRTVPGHVLAARKFSGPPPSDLKVERERQRLEKALDGVGLRRADEETHVYGYHDPFITPNFLRRNEVAVKVKGV
eukprot:CAMPEP_0194274672 /NCGR_PEP_ID=MMETSP0169-20130528/7697_1 /TAXON_ID=218684 /ORGANISM="Corethron pennatum, Strain L29A3" /LENGTH=244 /DNA_ID=CAMNT_0039017933 /DNA_START=56 /DNA_END=790 /DNA_ORIENTATION=-